MFHISLHTHGNGSALASSIKLSSRSSSEQDSSKAATISGSHPILGPRSGAALFKRPILVSCFDGKTDEGKTNLLSLTLKIIQVNIDIFF